MEPFTNTFGSLEVNNPGRLSDIRKMAAGT